MSLYYDRGYYMFVRLVKLFRSLLPRNTSELIRYRCGISAFLLLRPLVLFPHSIGFQCRTLHQPTNQIALRQ